MTCAGNTCELNPWLVRGSQRSVSLKSIGPGTWKAVVRLVRPWRLPKIAPSNDSAFPLSIACLPTPARAALDQRVLFTALLLLPLIPDGKEVSSLVREGNGTSKVLFHPSSMT